MLILNAFWWLMLILSLWKKKKLCHNSHGRETFESLNTWINSKFFLRARLLHHFRLELDDCFNVSGGRGAFKSWMARINSMWFTRARFSLACSRVITFGQRRLSGRLKQKLRRISWLFQFCSRIVESRGKFSRLRLNWCIIAWWVATSIFCFFDCRSLSLQWFTNTSFTWWRCTLTVVCVHRYQLDWANGLIIYVSRSGFLNRLDIGWHIW